MSRLANYVTAAAVALCVFGSGFAPASAACKKMGFLVNDYGKDGPTSDAQLLLDKHIAAWADKEGIDEYSVGKKSVKCELFLDFIVFDEHTCTASATVCWGGSRQPKVRDAKAKKKSKSKTAKTKAKSTTKKAVAKAPAKKSSVVKTVATKTEKVKPSKTGKVETSALPKPAVAEEAPLSWPVVPYATNAVIRNSEDTSQSTTAPKAPVTKTTAVSSERAAADRAAAAAERAAAAAERAAAAAQLAAEAAKQAAAAGQASRSAVVAPVKPTNAQ